MEELIETNAKLVDENLNLINIIEEKDKHIEYLIKKLEFEQKFENQE
jgi:hypothetical protein